MTSTARAVPALIAVVLVGVGCRAQLLRHDQNAAAAKAEDFLRRAAVEHDYPGAYSLIREEDRRTFSLQQLEDTVKGAHPSGFPTEVEASEYEPVPGQAAIQIFLVGKNDKETFYYRVPMVGTVDRGYFPQGLFRGNQAPPPSTLRRSLKGQVP